MNERQRLRFFLGGQDLEMQTIRELLERTAPGRFEDKGLTWGARASEYRHEIEQALARGETPVLIELNDDMGLGERTARMAEPGKSRSGAEVILVDHHGRRAGSEAPTSLHQVSELLGKPPEHWPRWYHLVAANDRAYLRGLKELGATREEMREVRAADWRAQGITEKEIADAAEAAQSLETHAGGRLHVAHLPHARTAPLVDRLQPELGGPGFDTLAVVSPQEVNVYGPGDVILALAERYPDGWYGGALPREGFWGHAGHPPGLPELLEEILQASKPVA